MPRARSLAVLAAAAAVVPVPDAAQVVTVHRLPVARVAQAMSAAVSACAAKGHRISVAVVEAYTAATYGRPSSETYKAGLAPDAPRIVGVLAKTILAPGGLPIKVGDETIGAISSSGASGPTSDEPCAQAGIDAITDGLR